MKMPVFKNVTLILFIVLLVGCAPTASFVKPDPSLNMSNATKLIIYRPSNDIMGIAIDLRVFVNGELIGTLNSGGAEVQFFTQPGQTTVEIKPYFMGIQDGKIAKAQFTASVGQIHYLRLSRDIGMPVAIGNTVHFVNSESGLISVSEQNWNKRK